MKKPRKALAILSALIFLSGVSTAGYAGFEIYQMNSNSGSEFLPELDSLDSKSSSAVLGEPNFDAAALSKTKAIYANFSKPKVGVAIGSLHIPRLNRTIPIIEGTGTRELKKGVGHYIGSVLPGVSDNSVLAGHRESVFRKLGDLKLGDLITVNTSYGKFVYEVHKIRIVMANDRTVIVPTPDAVLTLSTCYPFNLVGSYPKRYIVQAGLVIGEPVA
jgi:sortase A